MNVSVRLFSNVNFMMLEITFIKTIWNCARLGLVNKTWIFQVGEGRAGRLRLKDSQTTSLNSQKSLEAVSI